MPSSLVVVAKSRTITCPACARRIVVARGVEVAYKICRCGCRWGITFHGREAQLVREFA